MDLPFCATTSSYFYFFFRRCRKCSSKPRFRPWVVCGCVELVVAAGREGGEESADGGNGVEVANAWMLGCGTDLAWLAARLEDGARRAYN